MIQLILFFDATCKYPFLILSFISSFFENNRNRQSYYLAEPLFLKKIRLASSSQLTDHKYRVVIENVTNIQLILEAEIRESRIWQTQNSFGWLYEILFRCPD
jgi:hypothetical protein